MKTTGLATLMLYPRTFTLPVYVQMNSKKVTVFDLSGLIVLVSVLELDHEADYWTTGDMFFVKNHNPEREKSFRYG